MTHVSDMTCEPMLNFSVSFPFSYSKHVSDFRKTMILEIWDAETQNKVHLVGIVKLDLEQGHKYLLKNDFIDIKNNLYPLVM